MFWYVLGPESLILISFTELIQRGPLVVGVTMDIFNEQQKYLSTMHHIKKRVYILAQTLEIDVSELDENYQAEVIFHQVHIITEHLSHNAIALNLYHDSEVEVPVEYNTTGLLKCLQKIDMQYFPTKMGDCNITPQYLQETWEKYKRIRHAKTPYLTNEDIDFYEFRTEITKWCGDIVNLLDEHFITLPDGKVYYVLMSNQNGSNSKTSDEPCMLPVASV